MSRRTIVIVIGVLALAALGWGGYRRVFGRGSSAEEELQTFTVQRGRIASTVNAVGGVAPHRDLDLTFQASGRLVELEVEEGQQVEAGQILAQLDTSQLEITVAKARAGLASVEANLTKVEAGSTEAELASAMANLASAEENLARVEAGPTEAELASAMANLASAEENLARVEAGPTEAELASARTSLASAEANLAKVVEGPSSEKIAASEASLKAAQESYQRLLAGATADEVVVAEADLERSRLALEQAQANYDRVSWRPEIGSLPQSRALQEATIDYERALANFRIKTQGPNAADLDNALSQISRTQDDLNILRSSPTASELGSAEAQVAQARSQLHNLETSPTVSELRTAEAQVAQAHSQFQNLETSPTASELRSAEAQVAQARSQLQNLETSPTPEDLAVAQVQVEQANLSLQDAELRLRDAQMVAPFSGWVVSIQAEEGQVIGTNQAVVSLLDLSMLEIEVAMDEIDVSQVAEGQNVMVTLDALPGSRPSMGRVERVALAGTVTQGIVNYPVTISLGNPNAAIKAGMTANAQIIVALKEDVLVLPNRAVRRQGQQTVVEVLRDGERVEVPVTIGLVGEDASEVLEGLTEGEQVVIPGTSTSTVRRPGGMFFGGGPGR